LCPPCYNPHVQVHTSPIELGQPTTTLNIVFSDTYYLDLHDVKYMTNICYQVKMLMFYNFQTTKSTFVSTHTTHTHTQINAYNIAYLHIK
jgi:hypothetical protein